MPTAPCKKAVFITIKQEGTFLIIDRIEEQQRYYSIHPEMEQAFAFLAEAADLENGRYDLENGLYATISEGTTVPMESVLLEAHRKYIDLQYCLSGGERMGWANIGELNFVRQVNETDNYLYEGKCTSVSIRPGTFYIMLPGDAHKTGCHHEFQKPYKKGGRQDSRRYPEVKTAPHPACRSGFLTEKRRKRRPVRP